MKDGKFTALDAESVKALNEDQLIAYHEDKLADDAAKMKAIDDAVAANRKTVEESKEEIEQIRKSVEKTRDDLMNAVLKQGEAIKELARKGKAIEIEEGSFKKAFEEHKETFKKMKSGEKKSNFSFTLDVKATQTYGDIDAGEDFAQMRPGIIDQPIRRLRFYDIFTKVPLSTQFYKYVEQDSVVRDARNIANCAAVSTPLTKETLKVSSIEAVKVKDIIKVCLDFLDDYAFMRSRINKLINDSVGLKVDNGLLLDDGVAPNLNSIDSVSSEFNAANPIGDVSGSIVDANYIDLAMAMKTQVIQLGQENSFNPDYLVVNAVDWFIYVESKKDNNNNYLDYRVVRTVVQGLGTVITVGGMTVVTSPIVAQNTMYVFDSMKGEILDRRQIEIDIAFENGTDWESDLVSMKGSQRLNLLVPNEVANAFMKCSDVATALAALEVVVP